MNDVAAAMRKEWEAGERQQMRVVLVDPITRQPTACIPPDTLGRIYAGPFQNVAAVTEEWYQHELQCRRRIDAERERCAKIAEGFESDMGHGIPQQIADRIRSGQ